MKFLVLNLIPKAILILLLTSVCSLVRHEDSRGDLSQSGIATDTIRGNVLFRIRNSDFFVNEKKKKLLSVNEFRNFIPVFFYEMNGNFYIPNRLDNKIYKISPAGKVIRTISIPDEFEIGQFYITRAGEKYVLNRDRGLRMYSKDDQLMNENKNAVALILDVSNDNVLVTSTYDGRNKVFSSTDIKKIMNTKFTYEAHYCDYYFNDQFLVELSYDELATRFMKNKITSSKFDLRTLKLISKDSIPLNCKSCFSLPKLLSERWIVATNFEDPKDPRNELIGIENQELKKFALISPGEPLVDVGYAHLMNHNFIFSMDNEKKKLYALGTTESEVLLLEYTLP